MSYISEEDCKFIIKYYDSDDDGKLNLTEYFQSINTFSFNFIVLVNDDLKLRARATQRPNQFTNVLEPEVEKTLADLLEQ